MLSDVCQPTNQQGRKGSPKGENACRDLAALFMSSGRGRVMHFYLAQRVGPAMPAL